MNNFNTTIGMFNVLGNHTHGASESKTMQQQTPGHLAKASQLQKKTKILALFSGFWAHIEKPQTYFNVSEFSCTSKVRAKHPRSTPILVLWSALVSLGRQL